MTHFGGRSGHLEPIGAMGIKAVYFEEAGNQQAGMWQFVRQRLGQSGDRVCDRFTRGCIKSNVLAAFQWQLAPFWA